MPKYNLILSGGGVRSYAHLGVYKFLFEKNIELDEIVAVSGGALVAPFISLKWNPDDLILLFKKEKIHKKLFPFWFVPDKFEFLISEPETIKLGNWVEKQFSKPELEKISSSSKLHIMATRYPHSGMKAEPIDMSVISSLKTSIAASSAISGVFKHVEVDGIKYIDGGHWNNVPVFFDFQDKDLPVIASNLGYTGLYEREGGRISKIIKGFEIASYARLKDDIKRWDFEKTCGKRKELLVINTCAWDINSLNFHLSETQIERLIQAGYKASELAFKNHSYAECPVLV